MFFLRSDYTDQVMLECLTDVCKPELVCYKPFVPQNRIVEIVLVVRRIAAPFCLQDPDYSEADLGKMARNDGILVLTFISSIEG